MAGTLILLEFVDDAAQAWQIADREDAVIIPVSAEAVDWLSARGRLPLNIGEPSNQSADDELASENMARVREIVGVFDSAGRKALGSSTPGYKVGTCHAWLIMHMLNGLAFRCHRLRELLDRENPDRVVYFAPANAVGGRLYFERYESIWASIARAAESSHTAEGILWESRRSRSTEQRLARRVAAAYPASSLRDWIRRSEFARKLAREIIRGASRLTPELKMTPNQIRSTTESALMVLGDDAELSRASERLAAEGMRVWHWKDQNTLLSDGKRYRVPAPGADSRLRSRTQAFVGAVLEDPRFARLWSWRGIDCYSVGCERTSEFAVRTLYATAGHFEVAFRLLEQVRPRAVLYGEVGRNAWKRAALEAAGTLGFVRWCLQWGGNYGYALQPYVGLAEPRPDVFAAYTSAVAASIRETASLSPPVQTVVTGSLYFAELRAALRRRQDAQPQRVIYVLSGLTGNARYGPFLCLDDVEYHLLARRVASVLGGAFPGRVTLKMHPSNQLAPDPLPSWVRRTGLPVAVSTERLGETLLKPSVWVIDNVATSLQEVISTEDPIVYLHIGGPRLSPGAERDLRERVSWIEYGAENWEAQLESAVGAALTSHPTPVSDTFLTRWVSEHSNDTTDAVGRRIALALRNAAGTASRETAGASSFAPELTV